MKQRDLVKRLKSLGYKLDRTGNHMVYTKEGCREVEVPNHREINENTARAILKAAVEK